MQILFWEKDFILINIFPIMDLLWNLSKEISKFASSGIHGKNIQIKTFKSSGDNN